ncbi:hypothetical protein E3N88_28378 [Mikania micrantha]|uniref:Uncharacterized protein n=1 Tax=Mikania micrantha TaxID=192012 RepID=A0A5N6N0H1_9ASTR|nr:hypothetical protein E3N88_28378 [Mikania micrantha]
MCCLSSRHRQDGRTHIRACGDSGDLAYGQFVHRSIIVSSGVIVLVSSVDVRLRLRSGNGELESANRELRCVLCSRKEIDDDLGKIDDEDEGMFEQFTPGCIVLGVYIQAYLNEICFPWQTDEEGKKMEEEDEDSLVS